jgi:hypothetical protein
MHDLPITQDTGEPFILSSYYTRHMITTCNIFLLH